MGRGGDGKEKREVGVGGGERVVSCRVEWSQVFPGISVAETTILGVSCLGKRRRLAGDGMTSQWMDRSRESE